MSDDKEYLTFVGTVEGIGSRREAGKGPRKVEVKAKADDQFSKTFRCWENEYDEEAGGQGDEKSEEFAALEKFYEEGTRVTVTYFERHYQVNGKDRVQNVITGVEEASEDAPAGEGGASEKPASTGKSSSGGSQSGSKDSEMDVEKLAQRTAEIIVENMKKAGLVLVPASSLKKDEPEVDPKVREEMLADFLKQADEKAGIGEKAIGIRFGKLFGEGDWREASDEQLTALATALEFSWE